MHMAPNPSPSNVAAWLAVALLTGCSGTFGADRDGVYVDADPIVIDPGEIVVTADGEVVAPEGVVVTASRERGSSGTYKVPPGHYPPPGSCRVWYRDRSPGHQPPPGSCNVRVPRGAVLIRG